MPRKADASPVERRWPRLGKRPPALFFQTAQGNEPVRKFLKGDLSAGERKLVGEDIKSAEYGWPIGMPTCRSLGDGLHEVRTNLPNRIARVLFYVDTLGRMVLLHGFVKRSQQTPDADLRLAAADNPSTEEA